jgi:gliding motility-associated-like protein
MKRYFIILCLSFALPLQAQVNGIKIAGDTCTQTRLDLQIEGTSSSPYFFWNFGDPASGTNDTATILGSSSPPYPSHTFSGPGIYLVSVRFQEPGFPTTTVSRRISIGLCCAAIIEHVDSCLENPITFSISTGAVVNSITWNFGDPASGSNNIATTINPVHRFSAAGNYTIKATINSPCGIIKGSLQVPIVICNPTPCIGEIIVQDTCFNGMTTFNIQSTNTIQSIVWDFDDPSSGAANTATTNSPNHIFRAAQSYQVRAIVRFDCGIDTLLKIVQIIDCDTSNHANCILNFPNAFSPNKDNLNDYFGPLSSCVFEQYELLIFNRWGTLIFKSNQPGMAWDGTYKGTECPIGVYAYLVTYKYPNQATKIKKGDISLLH